jgi:hypothetical protein
MTLAGTLTVRLPPNPDISMQQRPDRIRKLLDLAKDQAGTPEGETAARVARRLMLGEARNQAGRACGRINEDDPIGRHTMDLGGRAPWRRRLSAAVARHCACVAAWERGGGAVVLFGHTSAHLIAEYLYTVLAREVEGASGVWIREDAHALTEREAEEDPDNGKRISAFCHSAVTAVDNRLAELRVQERGEDPRGTALVLNRGRDVKRWLKENGYDFEPSPARPWRYSQEGYLAGHRIGFHEAMRRHPDLPVI